MFHRLWKVLVTSGLAFSLVVSAAVGANALTTFKEGSTYCTGTRTSKILSSTSGSTKVGDGAYGSPSYSYYVIYPSGGTHETWGHWQSIIWYVDARPSGSISFAGGTCQ